MIASHEYFETIKSSSDLFFLFLIVFRFILVGCLRLLFGFCLFLFRNFLFYLFFQFLCLFDHFLEVVVAVFIIFIVLKHLMFIVVSRLIVQSCQEPDHEKRQVDPKCLGDCDWCLRFQTVEDVALSWEPSEEISPASHERVRANETCANEHDLLRKFEREEATCYSA